MIKKVFNIKLPKGKKTYGIKEMYNFFKISYPDQSIPYPLFVEIITRYNKRMADHLFKGEQVSLGHYIGKLRIKKVERKFYTKKIDWYQTNLLKKQGINQHVYYTEDFWLRFSWLKSVNLKNKSVYKFTPTKGPRGITSKLAKYCKSNPFAYQNFKTNPS